MVIFRRNKRLTLEYEIKANVCYLKDGKKFNDSL